MGGHEGRPYGDTAMRWPVLLVVSTLALAANAWAQSPAAAQAPVLTIPRVSSPPTLEQYLGAAPPGVPVTGFRQREPGDGEPVSRDTTAYLSYDDEHVYVGFVCREDPALVRAHLTRREQILEDDVVAVALDPYHDGRRSYLFMANPLGIQLDGVTAEGQDDDYTFDTIWRSEGRLTPDGFAVLFAIPFKSLRFANTPRQTWGFAVARIIPRLNETSFWPYVTRRIASMGQQLATLEGIEGVSPGRNLQAIPYASFAAARELEDAGGRVTDTVGRAGLDAKAVIKDAVTVDLTVNPDFSQVESDEPQVTVNQRFEVFFPEKRPFFIENANYFETPQQLFFSRRVADPDVGVRVTGRSRGWSFGGIVADDRRPGEAVPRDDPRHGDRAFAAVARVRREFARQSSVGAIATTREFGASSNRVAGVDGRWRIDDNWTVFGQFVGSLTEAPGLARQAGTSFHAGVSREGRGFDYSGSVLSRSPEFRADLGFIPRVDLIETEHEASYRWFPKSSRLLSVDVGLETEALWAYGGQLEEWSVEPGVEVELPGQTEIGARHWQDMERFAGEDFRYHTSSVYASTARLRWLALDGFYRWGTGINFEPAAGLRPFLGARQDFEGGVTLRPTSQLRVDQRYIFARLATRDATAGVPSGRPVFDNHILRTKANFQFTRELSARAILDYEAVLPNASLVALERTKRLGVDLLATYLVNPWTAVYVGYTDTYANLRVDPFSAGSLLRAGGPTTSVGRQVFVKVSYLLRY